MFSGNDPLPRLAFGSGWGSQETHLFEQAAAEPILSSCPPGSCSDAERIISSIESLQSSVRLTQAPRISYAGKFVRIWHHSIQGLVRQGKNPWRAFGHFKWVVIFFVAWEFARPWRQKQRQLRKGIGLDAFYTLFNSMLFMAILGTAICGVTHLMFADFLSRFFGIEHMVAIRLNSLPLWLRYVLMILILDFVGYWIHRLLHYSDTLWEFHKIHHSAKELDVFNAIKLHFVESLVYRFFGYVPLGLIGFGAGDVFVVTVFRSLFSMFTHANVGKAEPLHKAA